MFTRLRAYPLPVTPKFPPRPQTARTAARVEGVREAAQRKASLCFQGDADFVAGSANPPWWSERVHGRTGEVLNPGPSAKALQRLQEGVPNVRVSLETLRSGLGHLPWEDGRPVLDPMRRIRGEVASVEEEMQEHLWRHCTRIKKKYRSPCISERQYLEKLFRDQDKAQNGSESQGNVSLPEFLAVWNKKIGLMKRQKVRDPETGIMVYGREVPGGEGEEAEVEKCARGQEVLRPFPLTEAHAAAIFCKYGYTKDGLMPYEVFTRALFTPPARKLGMEEVMNNKKRGKDGFMPGDDPGFDGKILYTKSIKGVFSPSDFDSAYVERSSKAPTASLQLEWVHGYGGVKNTANNLFYNAQGDVVYYTAGVGVVYDVKEHKQRHFMGHNDDICCLNIHPNRRFMVSGQVKAAGPSEVPRACIWDSVSMQQLQCIGHPRDTRSVTAAAFTPGKGKFLLTCTSDNEHTLFLWNWMTAEKDPKAPPAWQYGPFRKLKDLEASPSGFFYQNEAHPCPPTRAAGAPKADELRPGVVSPQVGQAPEKAVVHSTVHHGMTALQGWDYRIKGGKKVTQASATPSGDLLHSAGVKAAQEKPLFDVHNPEAHKTGDGTYELVMEPVGAINGLPPAVYGIVFNPYDKSERPEFITYGVKHIKWWTWSAEAGTYLADNGKFGPTNVVNVLSAVFVQDPMGGSVMDPDTGAPLNFRELIKDDVSGKQTNKGLCKVTASGKVIKYQRSRDGKQVTGEKYIADMPGGDRWQERVQSTCVITGFMSGNLGIWLRSQKEPYAPQLVRVVSAHKPGPQYLLPDGSYSFGGVRAIKVREDGRTLVTAGADGAIHQWDVQQTVDDQPWMTAVGAQQKVGGGKGGPAAGLGRGAVRLKEIQGRSLKLKSVYAKEQPGMFRGLDTLPGSEQFIAGTNKCDIWEVDQSPRVLVYGHMADLYSVSAHPNDSDKYASCCISSRVFVWSAKQRTMLRTSDLGMLCKEVTYSKCGQHLAIGGQHGRIKIVHAETLQPLEHFKYCDTAIDELKYSPNNQYLAAGSHDMAIDIYDTGMRSDGSGKAARGGVAKYPELNNLWGDEALYKKIRYKGGYQHLCRCTGHSATIRHLDWSLPLFNPPELRGKTIIQSNCNSREILYFNPANGHQLAVNQRDAKWDTWTCSMGFSVMGIWGEGEENMDINCVSRSNSQEYVVVSNDHASFKLFNYPCVVDDAPHREYRGHSSHVTKARWSCDDRYVFTCGSGDRALMQWRTHGVNKLDACTPVYNAHGEATYASPQPHAGCDVDMCCFCGRDRAEKAPPPQWGPIDPSGKFWGPIGGAQGKGAKGASSPLKVASPQKAGPAPPKTQGGGGQQPWLADPAPLGDEEDVEEDVVEEVM